MSKTNGLALHVFRRDLRLEDNTALIEAMNTSDEVIPCFIFDTRQIGDNPYKSDASLAFMAKSLAELDEALRKKDSQLYLFHGIAEEVIATLLSTLPIDAVFINRDYTPFSRTRDLEIENACRSKNITFNCYADALLHEPEEVLKPDGKPYSMYTAAFNRASLLSVKAPLKNSHSNYYKKNISNIDKHTMAVLLQLQTPDLLVKGGRKEGLQLIKQALTLKNYETIRNLPAQNGTSKLSAHNKFGTVSIREVYSAIANSLGKSHTLIKELYWRDFFTHITFHFPYVLGAAFHSKYDQLSWSKNEAHFQAWCKGMTGFPIVDAGMRELNTTGYMHNRVRMITASFLVKDLHIDWRWGEKYFAQKLVDYDPAVNNGNWQWAASTGCDAQPYFRVFNPLLQQKKFDPDCAYIERWVPEYLEGTASYPAPIVAHDVESKKAKQMYKFL